MTRRILICGSRDFFDAKQIEDLMRLLPADDPHAVIMHGDAEGADTIANRYAVKYGFEVLKFPANWAGLGKRAGVIRNQQMLTEGKPTEVWAFYSDSGKTPGTSDMVRRAKEAGIPVWENL
jgi:hypothetical protein